MLTSHKSSLSSLALLSCLTLKGVGPQIAERLARCGIHTVQDLLFHLPTHYQDRTRIYPIGNLRPGDQAVLEGTIIRVQITRKRRASLHCQLADATGTLTLRFIYFTAAQKNSFKIGTRLRCFGEVRHTSYGLEIIHPEYQQLADIKLSTVAETLTPIYPSTEGLTQNTLRALTTQALKLLVKNTLNSLPELLPKQLRCQYQLPDITESLLYVHRPPPDADQNQLEAGTHPMQQRLVFEELLAHQLSLRRIRHNLLCQQAPVLAQFSDYRPQLLSGLPFQLTQAQQRVIAEISRDLSQKQPMLRLVQGDVGSGKTVVAACAILQAVESGFQAALMAPTELLAEQHYQTLMQWLSPLDIKLVWLASKTSTSVKKQALKALAEGSAQIAVGTHALFQKSVTFQRLGLMVIDEQHRFGVHQRLALRNKGQNSDSYPHQLVMTATPIPRTLAMAAYADLDQSILDELPPGRTPVTTLVLSSDRRDEVIARIAHACQAQRQVYWVCTLIEGSETLQCQAAEVTAEQLKAQLPTLAIGLIHGRMKPTEKQQIMASFKAKAFDILVATTVIEVGVDIPNASLMIIENPERLGLAQLHQLRGRVGRGTVLSFCVLMYQAPLNEQAKKRLAAIRDTSDGFKIAEQDLKMRGPGELLGIRQTGMMQMRIANLVRDQHLLPQIQKAADQLLLSDTNDTVAQLISRWLSDKERYGHV